MSQSGGSVCINLIFRIHMRPLGEALHAAGFSVRGILLPGHGLSVQEMQKSNAQQWLQACREACAEMLQQYDTVSVAGLSMGGVLAIRMAEEYPIAALIPLAPAMRFRSAVNYLAPVVKYIVPILSWEAVTKEGEDHRKRFKPEDFLFDYDYGYPQTPVAKVQDMMQLMRMARVDLKKVQCPALIIQSHRDESVHRSVPEMITRHISSRVKRIMWVDRSSHVCTLGPDREEIQRECIAFLQKYAIGNV
ncbi:MAG: alpha/beta fold hydrolase [Clostridia bacterium]